MINNPLDAELYAIAQCGNDVGCVMPCLQRIKRFRLWRKYGSWQNYNHFANCIQWSNKRVLWELSNDRTS